MCLAWHGARYDQHVVAQTWHDKRSVKARQILSTFKDSQAQMILNLTPLFSKVPRPPRYTDCQARWRTFMKLALKSSSPSSCCLRAGVPDTAGVVSLLAPGFAFGNDANLRR